jgi:holo-[acyl-carrier protein] synthase
VIQGTGIDIEEIPRIRALVDNWGVDFTRKLFTDKEIAYCESRPKPSQHFAARFAAKEAFAKALGTGWGKGFRWKDVEIWNDELGKPHIVPHKLLEEKVKDCKVSVSISHSRSFVAAVVIIEKQ